MMSSPLFDPMYFVQIIITTHAQNKKIKKYLYFKAKLGAMERENLMWM